jgi:hypothetical protein
MGRCYPGPGVTLGPALTFSWLAIQHAAGKPVPPHSSSLAETAT